MEQIVRKIDHFKNFLEVAAQVNGQIINYSKIAREVGIDDKTVVQYFQILEGHSRRDSLAVLSPFGTQTTNDFAQVLFF